MKETLQYLEMIEVAELVPSFEQLFSTEVRIKSDSE